MDRTPPTGLLKGAAVLLLLALLSVAACGSEGGGGGGGGGGGETGQPPAVTAVEPVDGATDAFAVPVLTATFSKPMDEATLTEETFLLRDAGGASIAGAVEYDAVAQTATFTPSKGLRAGEVYTAAVTTGAADLEGLSLTADHSWTFAPSGFFFVLISDTHVRIPGNPDDAYYSAQSNLDHLAEAIGRIAEDFADAAFVAHTGDMVGCLFSENLADYAAGNDTPADRFKAMMDALPFPYHAVMGNHDYESSFGVDTGPYEHAGYTSADPAQMEAIWKKVLGIDPYAAFSHEGVRMILLNSVRGAQYATPCMMREKEKGCTGSFDDAQMDWLEAELAGSTFAMLFFHHPLFTDTTPSGWAIEGASFLVAGGERFYGIAEAHASEIRGIFSGHGHLFHDDTLFGTIGAFETGSTGDLFGSGRNLNLVSVQPATGRISVVQAP